MIVTVEEVHGRKEIVDKLPNREERIKNQKHVVRFEAIFQFVAMARALLREPDLINRIRAGERDRSLCIHCNKCMPTIYRRTRCVLVPEG